MTDISVIVIIFFIYILIMATTVVFLSLINFLRPGSGKATQEATPENGQETSIISPKVRRRLLKLVNSRRSRTRPEKQRAVKVKETEPVIISGTGTDQEITESGQEIPVITLETAGTNPINRAKEELSRAGAPEAAAPPVQPQPVAAEPPKAELPVPPPPPKPAAGVVQPVTAVEEPGPKEAQKAANTGPAKGGPEPATGTGKTDDTATSGNQSITGKGNAMPATPADDSKKVPEPKNTGEPPKNTGKMSLDDLSKMFSKEVAEETEADKLVKDMNDVAADNLIKDSQDIISLLKRK